jgi:hypothetical protein
MNPSARDEGYNYIYSELVEDSDDILGIIAGIDHRSGHPAA